MSRQVMSIMDALKRYGQHQNGCGWYKHRKIEECGCGIAAAIHECTSSDSGARKMIVEKYCDPFGNQYGSHHSRCRIHAPFYDRDAHCDCGYLAAINGWPWDLELWEKKASWERSNNTEVMDLDEAFDRYAGHLSWCMKRHRNRGKDGKYNFGTCDCGFEALLYGFPWNPTYWQVKMSLIEPNGHWDLEMCNILLDTCRRVPEEAAAALRIASAVTPVREEVTPKHLKVYGHHDSGCNVYEPEACRPGPCNCGLLAAVNREPWNEAEWRVAQHESLERSACSCRLPLINGASCYEKW